MSDDGIGDDLLTRATRALRDEAPAGGASSASVSGSGTGGGLPTARAVRGRSWTAGRGVVRDLRRASRRRRMMVMGGLQILLTLAGVGAWAAVSGRLPALFDAARRAAARARGARRDAGARPGTTRAAPPSRRRRRRSEPAPVEPAPSPRPRRSRRPRSRPPRRPPDRGARRVGAPGGARPIALGRALRGGAPRALRAQGLRGRAGRVGPLPGARARRRSRPRPATTGPSRSSGWGGARRRRRRCSRFTTDELRRLPRRARRGRSCGC